MVFYLKFNTVNIFKHTYSPGSTVGRLSTKERGLIKKTFPNNFLNNKNKNAIGFYDGRRSLD